MGMNDLRPLKVVGSGSMGTVFLVQDGCGNPLALKVMSKSVMAINGNGFRRAQIERDILSRLDHPFLPALIGQVETEKIVGLVVDYCPGGNLHSLRNRQTEKMFSVSIIRFYAAEIVLALEHLHSLGIVYRDLKPENVLIQANGHIMLTDFDLSKRLSPMQDPRLPDHEETTSKQHCLSRRVDSVGVVSYLRKAATPKASSSKVTRSNSARVNPVAGGTKKETNATLSRTGKLNSFVGTEDYVSPEVVMGSGHDFPVDWWALGVLLYEMLYGKTPFEGATRKETFYNILMKEPQFMGPWTPLCDLIRRLLSKEPNNRLGSCNGADDVKSHPFFGGVNWEAVQHVSRAPFVPPVVPLHVSGKTINIEETVAKLQADVAVKLCTHHNASRSKSEYRKDNASPIWVASLSRAGQTDAFGVF